MKIILLRGPVPTNRNPKEIQYGSLDKSDCIYEHMAYYLGDEACEIVYHDGGKYEASYSDKCKVRFVKNLKKYAPPFEPDVIWTRGGFPEHYKFIARFPKAFIVYYGAGKRFCPEKGRVDLVLSDSEAQVQRIREKGYKAALWFKAATSQFRPMPEVEKKYDVGYVAAIPEDERKNCSFVYKHCPKDLRVLQLGFYPKKLKVPKNFKVKRIHRDKMPKALNKCKVVIAPYGKDDGNPRIISEALACGVPVIASSKLNYWTEKYVGPGFLPCSGLASDFGVFWDTVRNYLETKPLEVRTFYDNNLSMSHAVEHLRGLLP